MRPPAQVSQAVTGRLPSHLPWAARTWLAAGALVWAASAGAQTVTPPSIAITSASPVCSESPVVERVCVELPAVSTASKVDIFGLFDDTASFEAIIPTLTQVFGLLVGELEAALPGVDFGFGVGRFEDYGGPGFGFSSQSAEGRPFVLNQPIVTAADAGGPKARDTLVNDAFTRTAPGLGGDAPEAALEALYQVATGRGFDGDGNGTTTGEGGGQPAGVLATQQAPDGSGDVPAFSSLASTVVRSGSVGGVGFRPDALHLVILATDQCSVAAFDPGAPIPDQLSGAGVSVPVSEFACSSTDPGDNRFGYVSAAKRRPRATPPSHRARRRGSRRDRGAGRRVHSARSAFSRRSREATEGPTEPIRPSGRVRPSWRTPTSPPGAPDRRPRRGRRSPRLRRERTVDAPLQAVVAAISATTGRANRRPAR